MNQNKFTKKTTIPRTSVVDCRKYDRKRDVRNNAVMVWHFGITANLESVVNALYLAMMKSKFHPVIEFPHLIPPEGSLFAMDQCGEYSLPPSAVIVDVRPAKDADINEQRCVIVIAVSTRLGGWIWHDDKHGEIPDPSEVAQYCMNALNDETDGLSQLIGNELNRKEVPYKGKLMRNLEIGATEIKSEKCYDRSIASPVNHLATHVFTSAT